MLGVEIPTRGRPEWLLATLSQLYTQEWDALCVVASQPSDVDERAHALLQLFGQTRKVTLRVSRDPNVALPEKHQIALESLDDCDRIMIMHDDLMLCRQFFALLQNGLTVHTDVGAVAGVYPLAMYPQANLPADYLNVPAFNGRIEEAVNWHQVYLYPAEEVGYRTDVEHLFGPFMYRRAALEDAGGFPVGKYSRVSHREETDVTYRMFQAGWKLAVARQAVVPHFMYPKGGAAEGRAQMMQADERSFRAELNR